MATKKGQLNKIEQHRALIKAAMPSVETLVKEHGLSIVNSCITKLYEKRKLKKKADELRNQLSELEDRIR